MRDNENVSFCKKLLLSPFPSFCFAISFLSNYCVFLKTFYYPKLYRVYIIIILCWHARWFVNTTFFSTFKIPKSDRPCHLVYSFVFISKWYWFKHGNHIHSGQFFYLGSIINQLWEFIEFNLTINIYSSKSFYKPDFILDRAIRTRLFSIISKSGRNLNYILTLHFSKDVLWFHAR